jgi:hypothetical protein
VHSPSRRPRQSSVSLLPGYCEQRQEPLHETHDSDEYADLHGEMLKDISIEDRDKIYDGISLMQGLVSSWLVKNV